MFLFKTCKPCVYGVSQRGIYPFNFLLHLQSGTNDFFLCFIFIRGYLREFILSLDNEWRFEMHCQRGISLDTTVFIFESVGVICLALL